MRKHLQSLHFRNSLFPVIVPLWVIIKSEVVVVVFGHIVTRDKNVAKCRGVGAISWREVDLNL